MHLKTVRSRPPRRVRCALALSFALAVAAARLHAAITGVVVDENGAPLAHATVRAFAQETPRERAARALGGKIDRDPLASATTGDDGAFRLEAARPVVELIASADGRVSFYTDAADGDDLVAILLRAVKPLAGRVTADGRPVSRAVVVAGPLFVRSANDGTFSLPLVPSAALRLTVVHPDFAPVESISAMLDRAAEMKMTKGMAIRGRVLASDGRTPVAHASVSTGLYTAAETTEDGSFVIAHASPSWRTLRVIAPGGAAFATKSGVAAYDLRLAPAASISGSVRDGKTRAAIAGMRLSLWSQMEGGAVDTAITDARGAFAFSGVSSGRYNVAGAHPLYQIENGGALITLAPSERKSETYAAIPLARIRGSVIDEEKKPVAAAVVSAQSGQIEIARLAITNAKGEFSIRVAGTGGAPLLVSKDGYMPATGGSSETAGRNPVITLRRGFPLVVNVVDQERKPMAKASVSLTAAGGGADAPSLPLVRCGDGPCITGDDGRLEVRLIPGSYSINIGGQSVVPKNLPPQKIDEKSSPLTLTVDRGVVVSGRVVYSDGSPAAQTSVLLKTTPAVISYQQTDASGAFTFTNAPRGAVTLKVQISFGVDGAAEALSKDVIAPAADVVLTMPPSGRVTGTVLDATTRQPVTEFQIVPLRAMAGVRPTTFNSNDGSFAIEHVPAGSVDVAASAAGYVRGTVSGVEVVDGKTTANVEIRLDSAARVTGRVTSSDGAPLSGVYVVTVESNSRPGSITDSASTDSNGEYKLMSVPPGDRRLSFNKQGFVRLEKTFEAAASKETRLDAVLERGLELRGRVVDESGQAVTNANVRAQAAGDGSSGRSDDGGGFVISGLRDLHYAVTASKSGFAEARLDDVVPATSGPIKLTLRRGGTITGHVSGIPAGAAYVTVSVSGDRVFRSGRVDSAGSFSVSGVPDGNFSVEASAAVPGSNGRRTARVPVSVVNGTAAPVDLAFSDDITIQGRVTLGGRPAAGANVSFVSMTAGAPSAYAAVNADGTYSVAGAGTGDYRVNVMLPGGGGSIYSEKYTVTSSSVYDIDVRTGSLSGRITDGQSGVPLANAQVSLMNLDRRPVAPRPRATDLDGMYGFDQIVEGNWRLTVQKDGYRTETREVTVTGLATADVQLSSGAKTTLVLVDASDGRAVAGFVSVSDASKKPAGSAQAHSDGSVDLWLAPGSYTVFASAPQYYSDPVTITAPVAGMQIPMGRSGRVVVRWSRPGVTMVQLRRSSPGSAAGVVGGVVSRNPIGTFDDIRPAQYVVQLLGADNKAIAEQPVSVVAGQTATVVFP